MSVEALAPEKSLAPLLVGAGFADAYRVIVDGPPLDATAAASDCFRARRDGFARFWRSETGSAP